MVIGFDPVGLKICWLWHQKVEDAGSPGETHPTRWPHGVDACKTVLRASADPRKYGLHRRHEHVVQDGCHGRGIAAGEAPTTNAGRPAREMVGGLGERGGAGSIGACLVHCSGRRVSVLFKT